VTAVLDLSGEVIDRLHIATLGFSRRNIESMGRLMGEERIRELRLLCSHYFAGTSPHLYQLAVDELSRRPGAAFLSVRSHAKLLALRLQSGRVLTLESSANLRSCKNIEQLSIFGSPDLYAFHTGWMDELFTEGREHAVEGKAETASKEDDPATKARAARFTCSPSATGRAADPRPNGDGRTGSKVVARRRV
jgi:hypothetical protein